MTKKIYQCSKKCESCIYENKNPNGYDSLSECITDKCPNNQYEIGYIDSVNGRHTEDGNWNPKGEYCNKCLCNDCIDCEVWKNKQQEQKPIVQTTKTKSKVSWDDIFDDEPTQTTQTKKEDHVVQKSEVVLEAIDEDDIIVEATQSEDVAIETEHVIENIQDDIKAQKTEVVENQTEEKVPEIVKDIVKEIIAEKEQEQIQPKENKKTISIFDDDIDEFDLIKKPKGFAQNQPSQTEIIDTNVEAKEIIEDNTDNDTKREITEPIKSGTEINIEETEEKSTFEYINDLIKKILSMRWLKRNKGKKKKDIPQFSLPQKPTESDKPIKVVAEENIQSENKEDLPEKEEPQSTTTEQILASNESVKSQTNEPKITIEENVKNDYAKTDGTVLENAEVIQPISTSESDKPNEIVAENDDEENKDEALKQEITVEEKKEVPKPEEILITKPSESETKIKKPSYNTDNPYIKENWLDGEEDDDIDENGNIVQGIYRIDSTGTKTIVTAFDDDKNVRYTKYNKPFKRVEEPYFASVPETPINNDTMQENDEVEEKPEERYPDGINTKTNVKPQITVLEIEQKPMAQEVIDETNEPDETTESNEVAEEDIDIDFGNDLEVTDDGLGYDDGYNDPIFEEDDEIPEPEEYKTERQEYEDAGIETEEAEEVDEEYEDADFDMTDSAKFKASLLSPIGEEIARLQIKNAGVYLTVLGSCKITIKGRNDSDGFSYKDAKRFPKYIIDKVLNKSIYRDPNMEVIDNTYFNITYFEIRNEEIMPIEDVKLDITFDNPTPDNVKQVLYNEYKKFKNN